MKRNEVIVSCELLQTVLNYIGQNEVKVDGEWGECRTLKQLIDDNDMPILYHEIQVLLSGRNA